MKKISSHFGKANELWTLNYILLTLHIDKKFAFLSQSNSIGRFHDGFSLKARVIMQ